MSFSSQTKARLCAEKIKNRCCRKALLYGMLLFARRCSGEEIVLYSENKAVLRLAMSLSRECGVSGEVSESEGPNSFFRLDEPKGLFFDPGAEDRFSAFDASILRACPSCRTYFLRGVFLSCGRMTDPKKSYHLEFAVPVPALAETFRACLSEAGIDLRSFERNGEPVLYTKESEGVEDFLASIGAQFAAFEIMNRKIEKSIRNATNRAVNCLTSNLEKTVSASQNCINAIRAIEKSGDFPFLPPELRETALLRLQYPEASLAELAALHDPPVSKSGLDHRIRRIIAWQEKG